MVKANDTSTPAALGWRLKLGGALFALSMVGPPVLLPVTGMMGFSAGTMATVSGVVLVGAELLLLAAVAVMGKSGYTYLKTRIFGLIRQYGPPDEVSRVRYTVGLVMFAIPIAFGWIAPYGGAFIPGYDGNEIALAIAGDLLLLASLAVLGGDFWDKIRALFLHDAKAVCR